MRRLILFVLLVGLGCGDDGSQLADGPPTHDVSPPAADQQIHDAGPPAADQLPPTADGQADVTGGLNPTQVTLYVNLGDSMAAGYYADPGRSYKALLVNNDDGAYPDWAGEDLTTRYPGLKVEDRSKSGATTEDVVGQLLLLPPNPSGHTLVTISAGGNDFNDKIATMIDGGKTDQAADEAVANLAKVVAHFRNDTAYPGGATIVMLKVHDPTDGTGNIPPIPGLDGFCTTIQGLLGVLFGKVAIDNLKRFNDRLTQFAQDNNVAVADNHAHFLGHGFHHDDPQNPHYDPQDPTLWFHNDCAHGNNRGHHEVRALIWKVLFGE